MTKMYVPVIRADLALEETYTPPTEVAAFPIVAVAGTKPGRDKQSSLVGAEAAGLWERATSSSFKRLDVATDWYVLQEEAGVKAVLAAVATFMSGLS